MSAPKPTPFGYCAVEHGGTLFPDLLIRLVEAGSSLDPYSLYGVIRKMTCTGCAYAEIVCDPEQCKERFIRALDSALGNDHPMATFAHAAKAQYTAYYDTDVLGLGRKRPVGPLADLLANDLEPIFR